MGEKLFVYHLHSDYSSCTTNIDSATKVQMYIKKAKECGMTSLAFSEHGNIYNWSTKKSLIESEGMKYVHAIEFYLTESLETKVRDNYHILALARNWEGVKEINRLVTSSYNREDGHFYYNPRITLQQLLGISDNIILTSACLAGPLSHGNENTYSSVLNYFIQNKDRCFFEIQHHNDPNQIKYNQKLYELSRQYGVRLITGTDTHSLNDDYEQARKILQKSRRVFFENEDNFDMTFKDYQSLVESYHKQNSLPESVVLEAIDNTIVLENMIESFELDLTPKYPQLYENPSKVFRDKVYQAIDEHPYALKNHSREKLVERVEAELKVYEKTHMESFMLFQRYIREWEQNNGIHCGPGRGSVSGSMIAYLLGITQMDSIRFGLNFFRFANPDRQSNADIDSDYGGKDRDRVKKFLLENEDIRSSEIIAFGTLAMRAAVEYVCKSLDIPLDTTRKIKDRLVKNDKKEEIADEKLRRDFPEVFKYVDLINGVIISCGTHPSGVLCATRNIDEEIGLVTLKGIEHPVSSLDMRGLDSGWWTKMDILGLDNIDIINKVCEMVDIPYLTPDNTPLDDWEVWKSIREDNTCIFQYESDFGGQTLKKLFSDETILSIRKAIPDASYLKIFSFGNALLRPCGASIREDAVKGKMNITGVKDIDSLLRDELGYCIIQEDIMKFVMKFCGYSLNHADKVRKGIAKKLGTEKLLPEIKESFIQHSKDKYHLTDEKCESIINPILQCILDASRYGFSWNHAEPYGFIGYACGYLRYYYPLEFITACFNTWDDDKEKTKVIYDLAKRKRINIERPKFRYSKSEYFMNKETNSVYKGLSSIKYLSENTANYLYSLRDVNFDGFFDFLKSVDTKYIDNRQIEILIKLGYFEEFGNSRYLMAILGFYNEYADKVQVSKDKLISSPVLDSIFMRHSRETAKKYVDIDMYDVIKEVEKVYKVIYSEEFSFKEKVEWQKEFTGYIDFRTGKESDRFRLLVEEIKPLTKRVDKSVWAYAITTISIGSGKRSELVITKWVYDKNPITQYDIIRCTPNNLRKNEWNGKVSWRLNGYKKEV